MRSTQEHPDKSREKEPIKIGRTTPTMAAVNAVRFRLLSDLCLKLGGFGCSTCLITPALGGTVLYVNHGDHPHDRLGIAAVEHGTGWAYSWSGLWAPTHMLDQIAPHIAREVLT